MINEKINEAKPIGEAAVPEDVATLYSWANLHGAKYRDFSATRQEARSQARNRAHLEKIEKGSADQAPAADPAPEKPEPEPAVRGAWEELAEAAPPGTEASQPLQRIEPPPFEFLRTASQPQIAKDPAPVYATRQVSPHVDLPTAFHPPRHVAQVDAPTPAAEPQRPSRDSANSRWFALNSLLSQQDYAPEMASSLQQQRAREIKVPVLAIFSLAGGVGKTSMVATLGRALAARGEKVLLVDTNSYGLLPLYYGAKDACPGTVRTFSDETTHTTVKLLSLDVDHSTDQSSLVQDIVRSSQGADRVLLDLATGSSSLTRKILRLAPNVLVPLVPDISSLASLQAVESFFARQSDAEGRTIEPAYILNRFDPSLPLHQDMREALRQRLGDRLLPFILRRTPALSEALAEGMTVVDYSPASLIVEDYAALSTWIRNLSAPAGSVFRGHRWSEQ